MGVRLSLDDFLLLVESGNCGEEAVEVWPLILQDCSVLRVSSALWDPSALQEDMDLPSLVLSDLCLLPLEVVGSVFSAVYGGMWISFS